MKKLSFLFVVIILFTSSIFAQNWQLIDNNKGIKPLVTILSDKTDEIVIKFNMNAYNTKRITTPKGEAYIIESPELTPIMEKGAPDIPKFTKSLIISDTGEMVPEVVSQDYVELNNIDIAPSKGNFTRDIDPADVPFTYGEVYNKDEFFPGDIITLREPYILRDYRGQTFVIQPFQYNPVTKKLRIITEVIFRIKKTSNPGLNELVNIKKQALNDEFDKIYAKQFLNYKKQKYTPLSEGAPGNMLIICYSQYMSAMQDFVNWKRQKGIATEIVDVSTIGTTASAIKSYVANYYNTNGLVYLLLVGDAPQVPSSSTSAGDSDVDYGYISGNDHYAEIFVGRFSAQSVTEVQTQVNRTIEYEKTPVTGDWWSHALAIGSDQGPGDDNEYDYQHEQNIVADLMGYTYTSNAELYDGSQGGNDAAGNPTPAMVATEVNAGSSIICYTGHGSSDSFVTTGFSISDVNSLTNNNKYPFIFSVACVNGDFVSGTCFAESWLRATNNGQPSGAIATLMSTINQSWNPPMHGQDEMIDILVESYSNNIKRTFAGIAFNGCFEMNDEYADYDMTDTWTVFGDPSVMVRTMNPQAITVTHNSTLTLGVTNFVVNCNVENALVSLTKEDNGQVTILGTGYISGGTVDITIPAFTAPDTMLVTVTAYNHQTYTGNVTVIASSGPYVVYNSHVVQDVAGNNNNLADYNENITLDMTLENVGVAQANNVSATISTSNSYITINDNNENYGNIAAGNTATQNNAYALSVADGIPDQTSVLFDIAITDGTNNWNGTFSMICNAPAFEQSLNNIDDASGDQDGQLDPGETVTLNMDAINNGHADSEPATITLTTTSPYITINSTPVSVGNMAVSNTYPNAHSITVSPGTPTGTVVDLTFTLVAGSYTDVYTLSLNVGLMIEDWESNSFNTYDWQQGGDVPWIITSSNPYEGTFCAVSGDITHNQTSELFIDLDVINDDTITFYKKVSCEQGYISWGYPYDYLEFKIDNNSMGMWDGEIDWSLEAYPVSAGVHNLRWIYSKDGMEDGGSDCAWVDYIKLPAHNSVTYVEYLSNIPDKLSMNVYPNPISETGKIQFEIPENMNVNVEVTDLLGRNVKNIFNNKNIDKGIYNIILNASEFEQGYYFVKLTANDNTLVEKVLITK